MEVHFCPHPPLLLTIVRTITKPVFSSAILMDFAR